MNPDNRNEHLRHLAALWAAMENSHPGGGEADPTLRQLLEYYGPAVHRYLPELLARTWDRLEQDDPREHLHLVLRYRRDHPESRSAEMAEGLSTVAGRRLSPDWVRNRLALARDRFAELLVGEIVGSLEKPTREAFEQELRELGLFEYCKSALHRFWP